MNFDSLVDPKLLYYVTLSGVVIHVPSLPIFLIPFQINFFHSGLRFQQRTALLTDVGDFTRSMHPEVGTNPVLETAADSKKF